MSKAKREVPLPRIYTVRKQKVVLDADLAKLYGVPTSRLNEAVKRNGKRFPGDFAFHLTRAELDDLRSQIAISSSDADESLRSQNATLKKGHGGTRTSPRVFTEHGALMAANVLRSEKAVEMSVYLIRAFVEMRETLLANTNILKRLAEIDRRLIEHDSVLREVINHLQPLLDGADEEPEPKPKIGYHQGNR